MNKKLSRFDGEYFLRIVDVRCGMENFLILAGISEKRFLRLISGKIELRQAEMLRYAGILNLNDREFMRCFFKQ